jgi:hypothetical protein
VIAHPESLIDEVADASIFSIHPIHPSIYELPLFRVAAMAARRHKAWKGPARGAVLLSALWRPQASNFQLIYVTLARDPGHG